MIKSPAERRKFFRHPTSVPIECRLHGHEDFHPHEMRDISHGGIAFVSDRPYELGDIVELKYPTLTYPEIVRGMIVWTIEAGGCGSGSHINGLSFSDESARFHGRMVEQIAHIEAYRGEQRQAHARDLTHAEAASEWITTCADQFPA